MKRMRRGEKGFTLLEIIVVLAVIGALAAILSPVVFRYIDDANRARAQADANTIAAAVQQMYKDTGRWPAYAAGTGALTFASTDADVLSSNTACDGSDDVTTLDTTEPVDSTTGSTWALGADLCDSLTRQLITNASSYTTTGNRAWKGPYLDTVPALDPWGRSYLVNIKNANPNEEGPTTQKWVVVISAGPDGNLDTAANTVVNTNPAVAGDDVVARVK